MKHSVSNLHVLFCPCVVLTANAHVETKALNIFHQSQKDFRGISVGITQYKKVYLFYADSTRKIFSSHDVVFDKKKLR